MNATSRSRSRSAIGSIPARSAIASRSGTRGHGGVRSIAEPAATPAAATTCSVRSMPPSKSVYASYHSSIVNSGLRLKLTPSLRKSLLSSYTRSMPPTISRLR